MRNDTEGLFWNDAPPPKPPKTEKEKRTPPEPVWLNDDYLPHLEEARAFKVKHFTKESLMCAQARKDLLVYDCESFGDYFLVAFTSFTTGEVIYFETYDGYPLDNSLLYWILTSFCCVGFNSNHYDRYMLHFALHGYSAQQLFGITQRLIVEEARGSDLLRGAKIKRIDMDQIDLIEVAPLRASLKIYGGRLHCPRMQNLPFPPERMLTEDHRTIVRWYCVNDLSATAFMLAALREQLQLRVELTRMHQVDMRSKSDPQLAEAIIASALKKMKGYDRLPPPKTLPGQVHFYQPPHFLKFATPYLNDVLALVRSEPFVILEHGGVAMPERLAKTLVEISNTKYQMGVGGLHSTEKCSAHKATPQMLIKDLDVASYYPKIIEKCNLFPAHLGREFLQVYTQLVRERLKAKAAGQKQVAESLKITVNGAFGKFGSPYSSLYAPQLLLQVTLTGQLALLMLIEAMELNGFRVVSANTDGIVILCPADAQDKFASIVKQWEKDTGFETEETEYSAIYSRDVNNYIAIKKDGHTKNKGEYANPWGQLDYDTKQGIMRFHKNPVTTICIEAVEQFLINGTDLSVTIRNCADVRKFVAVRHVKGGAVKNGEYLGSAVRWYYATDDAGEIVYAKTGNRVARSKGAKPCMLLPETLPADIDYEWYEREAYDMLIDLGAVQGEQINVEADQ